MSLEQVKERLEERKRGIDLALRELEEVTAEGGGVEGGATVAEMAKEVLREGQPLRTKDLAARILARGFVSRSRNFYPVVYKTMRTHGEFEKTPQGWLLKQAS